MVATAGSVSNISYISWKSVQVFLLCVESELEKLPLAKDLQTVLEFPLLTSQERATAGSKSGATHYLSLHMYFLRGQQRRRSAEKEATRVPSSFSVGSGQPMIPRKTAEKKWAGEYID